MARCWCCCLFVQRVECRQNRYTGCIWAYLYTLSVARVRFWILVFVIFLWPQNARARTTVFFGRCENSHWLIFNVFGCGSSHISKCICCAVAVSASTLFSFAAQALSRLCPKCADACDFITRFSKKGLILNMQTLSERLNALVLPGTYLYSMLWCHYADHFYWDAKTPLSSFIR